MSMFLAFLIDQIQEVSCLNFQRMKKGLGGKSYLFNSLSSGYEWLIFRDWSDLYGRILKGLDLKLEINSC